MRLRGAEVTAVLPTSESPSAQAAAASNMPHSLSNPALPLTRPPDSPVSVLNSNSNTQSCPATTLGFTEGSAKISQAVCQAKGDGEEGPRDADDVGASGSVDAAAAADNDDGGRKCESTHVTTACGVPVAVIGRLAEKRSVVVDEGDSDGDGDVDGEG